MLWNLKKFTIIPVAIVAFVMVPDRRDAWIMKIGVDK